MEKFELARLARQHLPALRSKLAFGPDQMLVTMMYLLHNNGKCLARTSNRGIQAPGNDSGLLTAD